MMKQTKKAKIGDIIIANDNIPFLVVENILENGIKEYQLVGLDTCCAELWSTTLDFKIGDKIFESMIITDIRGKEKIVTIF